MDNALVASRGRTRAVTPVGFEVASRLLARADVWIDGPRPWDIQVRHPNTLARILKYGSLGLGESYVDGWWDCAQLDALVARVLAAKLDEAVVQPGFLWSVLRARLFNLQSTTRAWQVGRAHYDLGNDLYQRMLDPTLAYSCGYWASATNLEQAQRDKLDLICRKLGLVRGMRLLDIGCGFGSLMRHAAEHYGVQCVGLTVSVQQRALGTQLVGNLPVRFELIDYRDFNRDGMQKFDRIASVGMFEHVGAKNYRDYFDLVRRSLVRDGLFLLHTIGRGKVGAGVDPWIEKYIFPNAVLPSMSEITRACEGEFVIEDWHNFGADYDRTLTAWHARFEAAWPELQHRYDERFHRLWRYYLLCCAGAFRARANQLWQLVLSPEGIPGGWRFRNGAVGLNSAA
jgi:cyclopropane-fatty-acyl-phospholipid synthase